MKFSSDFTIQIYKYANETQMRNSNGPVPGRFTRSRIEQANIEHFEKVPDPLMTS